MAGAFSGKDPSKVDRSAAYAARWVAKHVVASGAASRCEVQVAYAIGVGSPCPSWWRPSARRRWIRTRSSRPCATSSTSARRPSSPLDLRQPTTRRTVAYGHFGRNEPGFTWEDLGNLALHLGRRTLSRRRELTERETPAAEPPLVARVVPDVTGLDKQFDYLVPGGARGPGPFGHDGAGGAGRPAGWGLGRLARRALTQVCRSASCAPWPRSAAMDLSPIWWTWRHGRSHRWRRAGCARSCWPDRLPGPSRGSPDRRARPSGWSRSMRLRPASSRVAAGCCAARRAPIRCRSSSPRAGVGPTLVIIPSVYDARLLGARLRRSGLSVAVVPKELGTAAAGGVDVVVGVLACGHGRRCPR